MKLRKSLPVPEMRVFFGAGSFLYTQPQYRWEFTAEVRENHKRRGDLIVPGVGLNERYFSWTCQFNDRERYFAFALLRHVKRE